jgi:hypothetical protein
MNDIAVQQALLLIKTAPELQGFRDWLVAQQLLLGDRLVSAESEVELRNAQGAARFLRDLTKKIEVSGDVLARIRGEGAR